MGQGARSKGDNTLYGVVGPEQASLLDCYGCWVVGCGSTILEPADPELIQMVPDGYSVTFGRSCSMLTPADRLTVEAYCRLLPCLTACEVAV